MASSLEAAIRINIDTRDGVGNVEALNAAVKKTLQQLGRAAYLPLPPRMPPTMATIAQNTKAKT